MNQMDDFISTLNRLIKSPRLQPAEKIICDSLINFENILPPSISDDLFNQLESLLISLLKANKGELSLPCSIRISMCLLNLYKTDDRARKTWNLYSDVSKKPFKSTIYATGYITNFLGVYASSMISGFAKVLINNQSTFLQPVLYALNFCFKRGRREMNAYVDKTVKLLLKSFTYKEEDVLLLSVRLLRTLLKSIPSSNLENFMQKIYILIKSLLDSDQISVFVKEEIYFFLAKYIILEQRIRDEENNMPQGNEDFKIEHKSAKNSSADRRFSRCTSFINEFKNSSNLFHKFFLMLSPEFIHNHLEELFVYIKNHEIEYVNLFLNLISSDDKTLLFEKLNKESFSANNLFIMRMIAQNEEMLESAAAFAFQTLSTTKVPSLRDSAAQFFSKLSLNYPDLASEFVQTSTLFISNPPEGCKNIQLKGMAVVASTILMNRPEIANEYKENIVNAIAKGLGSNRARGGQFQASLALMTVVDETYFSLSAAEAALELFSDCYDKIVIVNDEAKARYSWLASHIAMLIAQYPKLSNASRAMKTIYTNDALHSHASDLCLLKSFSHIEKDHDFINFIGKKLQNMIISSTPPMDFVFSQLKNAMMIPSMLIKRLFDVTRDIPKYIVSTYTNVFAQNAVLMFPEFILSLPNDQAHSIINNLICTHLFSASCKSAPSLIYILLKNDKTNHLFPSDLFESLFSAIMSSSMLLNSSNSSYSNSSSKQNRQSLNIANISMENDLQWNLRVQTLSECIALFVKGSANTQIINNAMQRIMSLPVGREKCFLLSAIFSYIKELSDNDIINSMLELNSIALSTEFTSYALFALMVLYQQYIFQLSKLSFTINQLDFFFTLIQQEKSLNPYIMYYMAQAYNALLSIISPEIQYNSDSSFSNAIYYLAKNIILSFGNIEIPYSTTIYYHVLRAALNFARNLVVKEELHFPTSRSLSIASKTNACGVFSDYAKIVNQEADFFDLMPYVFMLIQITSDNRAIEFVNTLVNNFVNKSIGKENEEFCINRLKEWVKIIKSPILIGTQNVSTSDSVKKCALTIANMLLPIIRKTNPLLTSCLDDIVSTSIRSVQNNNLRNDGFCLLISIIDKFNDVVDESGKRILELYDSQFSSASKIAFSDLKNGGDFLVKLLMFHIKDLESNENIFNSFIDGIKNAHISQSDGVESYISICAELTEVSKKSNYVLDRIDTLKVHFIKLFSSTIKIGQKYWYSDNPNWNNISSFRSKFSAFFSTIISSLIWLLHSTVSYDQTDQTNIPSFKSLNQTTIISIQELLNFFEDELTKSQEVWRISASLIGISNLIQFDMIASDKLKYFLNLLNKDSTENSNQHIIYSLNNFQDFLSICSSKADNSEIWPIVFQLFLNYSSGSNQNNKNPNIDLTLSRIIYYGNEKIIREKYEFFYDRIITFPYEQRLLLFTILFDKVDNKDIIDVITLKYLETHICNDDDSINSIISFIYRSLKRSNCKQSIDKIFNYGIEHFTRGGCELLGMILNKKELYNISNKYIESESFLSLFEKYDYNSSFALNVLRLGQILVSNFKDCDKILSTILHFSLYFNANSIETIELARKLIECSVQIWREINQTDKLLLKIGFKTINIEMLEKLVNKMERSSLVRGKRAISLKAFSTKKTYRKVYSYDSEWQDLS